MTRQLLIWLGLVALLLAGPAWAGEKYDSFGAHSPKVIQSDDTVDSEWDEIVKALKVTLKSLLACEDVNAGVCVVEERYLTVPIGASDAMFAADQLVKTGSGYVKDLICFKADAATAGTISVRDATVAGTGAILGTLPIAAQAYTDGVVLPLSTSFSVGLFADFTNANTSCYARFR